MSKIVPFVVTYIDNAVNATDIDEKTILSKQAKNPLLMNFINGKVVNQIKIRFTRPIKQLKSIVFKNAGAVFITITLGDENQIVYPKTQQCSWEQFNSKQQTKLTKAKLHKVNNKFTTSDKEYRDATITIQSFYDFDYSSQIGLSWIEFVSM